MVKYIWRCGDRYATIEMFPEDMERIKEDAFSLARFEEEIDVFLGTHPHEFKQIIRPEPKVFRLRSEITKDPVIYVCEKCNPPKKGKTQYDRERNCNA